MRAFVACSCLLALAACSSIDTDFDYDPCADYSRMHAYAWAEAAARSPLHASLQAAVDAALAERGFQHDGMAPDFLVAARLAFVERVTITDYGDLASERSTWSTLRSTAPSRWELGQPITHTWRDGSMRATRKGAAYALDERALVIEVFDPASGSRLWRGTASRLQNLDWTGEERAMREAVSALLGGFPPR